MNTRILLAFGLVIGAAACSQALADQEPQVTICHATASSSNPYTQNTVDQSSIWDGETVNGHGLHAGDIIPAFGTYPGQNLGLLDILANGCDIPPTTTEPPATTTPPDTTVPPTTEPPTTEPPATTEPPTTTTPPCTSCTPPPPPHIVPPIHIDRGPVSGSPSQTG
jgi:hypothetical protein